MWETEQERKAIETKAREEAFNDAAKMLEEEAEHFTRRGDCVPLVIRLRHRLRHRLAQAKEHGGAKIGPEKCSRCQRTYQMVYRFPDGLWGTLMAANPGGLLCPDCAHIKAEQRGIFLYWEAMCDRFPSTMARRFLLRELAQEVSELEDECGINEYESGRSHMAALIRGKLEERLSKEK